jgi:xanthine dehydrogenase accessory factor
MIKGDLSEHAGRLVASRRPFVTATVVRTAKPTSVRPGDTALVLADGTIEGFVGGVCAQSSVRLHAAKALETGEAVLLRLIPGTAPADGEPATPEGVVVAHNPCLSGGSLEIFLEPVLPAQRIVILGDTPIARAIGEVARAAGFEVAAATAGGPSAALGGHAAGTAAPDATDAAFVVASHGDHEEESLAAALEAGVGYVGLVASRRRGAAVIAALDVPEALRDQVHTPAGLDIGARTPPEIAVAILAEVIARRTSHPAPATATDPVCGMTVPATEAQVHLDVEGERVYFCCEGCRASYAAART